MMEGEIDFDDFLHHKYTERIFVFLVYSSTKNLLTQGICLTIIWSRLTLNYIKNTQNFLDF